MTDGAKGLGRPKEILNPESTRVRLVIAYDGSQYQGWQVQKIGTGVQEKIEQALGKLFPSSPRLHSSSRTDTGVHALGMVAHFDVPRTEFRMEPRKLALALNAWLAEDIRIVSAQRARWPFHARFDATGKQYRYYIWNHAAMNPLLRHTAWHVPRALDIASMRSAARFLVGTHDFQSFTANPGYAKETTVRTLTHCDLVRSGPLLTLKIQGDGFLYRMCRGIAGTLVQVGLGKWKPEAIKEMIRKRNRSVAGMSAPAHGLVLHKVLYGKPKKRATGPKRALANAPSLQ